MNNDDRFAPPRAKVGDVSAPASGSGAYQPVKIWSIQGRIGRLRLLAYSVGAYLILAVAMFVFGLVGSIVSAASVDTLTLVGMVVLFIPYLVLTGMLYVQRSHDMGWPGWSALGVLIPFVALVWIFKSGTRGANAYGNPPPPNSVGVKILGLMVPVVAGIGILAAAAIPAYQQYVLRAKAAQDQFAPTARPAETPSR